MTPHNGFRLFDSHCVAELCISSRQRYVTDVTMVTSRQVCLWKILTFALTCRLLALDIKHPLCRDAQASLTYLLLQVELFFLGVGQKLRTDMLILQSILS